MDMKKLAGDKAATYVKDGMVVGLGTGSTAYHMVNAVGEMVKNGLKIQAIPTSKATEAQARELGIPLLTIDELDHVDLAIDGVDEIDPQFNAIKGGGGALYREKVVASMAKEVIWIMDESKLVDKIGAFHLPVEIAQYGSKQAMERMAGYGWNPVLRVRDGKTFVTDNGNYIADLHLGAGFDIQDVYSKLTGMLGVLEHGLFLNMCKRMIVGHSDGTVDVIENPSKQDGRHPTAGGMNMDYNERNGSYSDDELLSRFSRPETPHTTVQDDIPDDPAALRRDRGPRPGIRMASGRPMRGMKMQRPAGRKGGPNYRAALCGAVLAFFVIALLFFVLFMSRGGKIKELNSQIDTLGQDKQSLSAQITSLQQQVDTLTASMTSALPDATVADTNTIADLIPQLADGSTYVVQSSASQLRYIKVPEGYLSDKLGEYRDNSSAYAAAQGDAPICTYYVLFTDRVIGLAEGNVGFVSMDRAATGSTTTTPDGFYDFVASFFK